MKHATHHKAFFFWLCTGSLPPSFHLLSIKIRSLTSCSEKKTSTAESATCRICVLAPPLRFNCDFALIFLTLWFCSLLFTSQYNFTPIQRSKQGPIRKDQGQNHIDLWKVKGKIINHKVKKKQGQNHKCTSKQGQKHQKTSIICSNTWIIEDNKGTRELGTWDGNMNCSVQAVNHKWLIREIMPKF